jgi:hypothetical protein
MFDTEVRKFVRAIAGVKNVVMLMVIAAALALTSFAVTDGYNEVYGLVVEGFNPLSEPSRIFNVDQEVNIPTWFNQFLYLYAAVLALVASFFAARTALEMVYWRAVSGLCIFLSLNEVAGFHELLIDPLRGTYELTGIWYQSWTIVGITLIGLAGVFFVRFFWELPRKVMVIMVVGALIHVTGSIGFEMIGGNHLSLYGYDNFYIATATAEEFLEMVGVTTFLFGIMVYVRSRVKILDTYRASDSKGLYEYLLDYGNLRYGYALTREPRGMVVTERGRDGEKIAEHVQTLSEMDEAKYLSEGELTEMKHERIADTEGSKEEKKKRKKRSRRKKK